MTLVKRRALLVAAPAAAALGACASAGGVRFASVAEALTAIEGLKTGSRSTGAWSLPQVLAHLAQSIEYSMSGFPEAKSPLFQRTVGAAAFAWFDARGQMNHSLKEPIPGAPLLEPAPSWDDARRRLVDALRQFEAHARPLMPHFAYGALDKLAYTRAHLMHVADHWQEIVNS